MHISMFFYVIGIVVAAPFSLARYFKRVLWRHDQLICGLGMALYGVGAFIDRDLFGSCMSAAAATWLLHSWVIEELLPTKSKD